MTRTLLIVSSPVAAQRLSGVLPDGWSVASTYGDLRALADGASGYTTTDGQARPVYALAPEASSAIERIKAGLTGDPRVVLAHIPDDSGISWAWHTMKVLGLPAGKVVLVSADEMRPAALSAVDRHDQALPRGALASAELCALRDRLVESMASAELGSRNAIAVTPARIATLQAMSSLLQSRIASLPSLSRITADIGGVRVQALLDVPLFRRVNPGECADLPAVAERAARVTSVVVLRRVELPSNWAPPLPAMVEDVLNFAVIRQGAGLDQAWSSLMELYDSGLISYPLATDAMRPSLAEERITAIDAWLGSRDFTAANRKPTLPNGAILPLELDGVEVTASGVQLPDACASALSPLAATIYAFIVTRVAVSRLTTARLAVVRLSLGAKDAGGSQGFVYNARAARLTDEGWTAFPGAVDADFRDTPELSDCELEPACSVDAIPEVAVRDIFPVVEGGYGAAAVEGITSSHGMPVGFSNLARAVYRVQHLDARDMTSGLRECFSLNAIALDDGGLVALSPAGQRTLHALAGTSLSRPDVFVALRDALRAGRAQNTSPGASALEPIMAAVRADLAEMRRKPLWSGDNDVVDYPGECVTPSTPVATSTPASAPTTGGAAPESAAAAAPAQAPREPQVADADPMACPECGSMLARRSTAGGGAFWGCSDFPRCRGTRPDDGGSPMVAAPPVPCKICGTGMMRQLCGKRGRYWRCDNASCGTTANDEGGSPSCGGHGSSQERALLSRRKRAPKGTVLGEHAMPLQWRPDGATAAVPEHEDDGDA